MRASEGPRRPRTKQLRLVPYGAVNRHWDFNPDDVARLEAAHARVLDAAKLAGRRLARQRDRERLVEAEAAERAVLSWMGVPSWLEYRLRAAGVVEMDDILSVVDLTRPQVPVQAESPDEVESAEWARVRPLLRNIRG
jgi:hypothetical protein